VNNIEIPSSIYLSVEYTEGLATEADSRDSYKGITLRVEYGLLRPVKTRSYFTGDFAADYQAAIEWAQGFGQADTAIPFLASSTLDSFMYEAGYAEASKDADNAMYAEMAADEAKREWLANNPGEAYVARVAAITDRAIEIDRKMAAAWDKVPAVKLRWALANVIATSDYNTTYPSAPLGRAEAMDALKVLDELLADEAFAASMRP